LKVTNASYRFSKIINAPVRFVYDWCTDYSAKDPNIPGAKQRRRIIEKTKNRAVYINQMKDAKTRTTVNIVKFHPPDRWHLDLIGEERNGTGEYRLRKVGPRRTRLDITLEMKWKIAEAPTRTEFHQYISSLWSKYVVALERDFVRNNASR